MSVASLDGPVPAKLVRVPPVKIDAIFTKDEFLALARHMLSGNPISHFLTVWRDEDEGTGRFAKARPGKRADAQASWAYDTIAGKSKRKTSIGFYPKNQDDKVTITAVFDFSTFPDVTGTFSTTGALTISGAATMHVDLNENGVRAHCVVTLIAPDGSIIIHQQCQFSSSPPKGRWEIVSGTGAYADLDGNGSLTMPPFTEAMTGVIYR